MYINTCICIYVCMYIPKYMYVCTYICVYKKRNSNLSTTPKKPDAIKKRKTNKKHRKLNI